MELKYHKVVYNPETGLFTKNVTNRKRETRTIQPGWTDERGYRRLTVNRQTFFAHRLAWFLYYGEHPKQDIDHINGVKDDNRISNLRDVSKSVNLQNRKQAPSHSSSGVLGVSWHEGCQKWRAAIQSEGKKEYLGLFSSKEEAHSAYVAAKRQLHEGNTL